MDEATINRKKKNVTILSIASNCFLVVMKLVVGFAVGSVGIISEGIHSSLDLLAAVVAFFAVKTASNPPDDVHNFGHGKAENISSMIEAILILIAAVLILKEAIEKIHNPSLIEGVDYGILVMLASVLLNWFVSSRLMKVAKETDSAAIEADAWHLRTDIYTSLGVFGGLVLIRITGIALFDPLCALVVAGIIGKVAWDLIKESFSELMDQSLSKEDEEKIIAILNGNCRCTRHDIPCRKMTYHALKTRKSGKDKFVEVHFLVPTHFDIKEAHDLAEKIENELIDSIDNINVMMHLEPYNDEELCEVKL